MTARPLRLRGAGALAAAAALLVSGCSATGAPADPESSGDSGPAPTGVELTAGQFSWTAAAVETEILAAVVEDHPELGVSSIETVNVDPATGWVGLGRGDIDLLTEVNLPNQQKFADETDQSTELVSRTYGDAAQGWFVPRYLVEPGGAAEGLKSVDQLDEYAEEVGGVLYDGDPGWVTTDQNAQRLEGFGLDIEHRPSSEAASIAQLKRAYHRQEPVLVFAYRPHWLFEQYDLVQLEEPSPYEEDCFTGEKKACAIPAQDVWTAAHQDVAEQAPAFHEALGRFQIPLEEIEAILKESEDTGAEPADLARQWVDGHQDEVESWLG
ncbi:glycine betaine ABC transporter substrate-binding protein [Kocuria arenosa]|uniref:glycine betaine ABC transporter substrate-binding protein n=1 Tax=Kocuria arenosa TaxID=3071446 RepID=UPI0034D6A500